MASAVHVLQRSFALIPTHGFTRHTLALAGASGPSVSVTTSMEPDLNALNSTPLTEGSVTALFGPGNDARRTLIEAWLADVAQQSIPAPPPTTFTPPSVSALKLALGARLRANAPVLHHLPEAFAFMASPDLKIAGRTLPSLPLVDPRPGLAHSWKVADRACLASGLGKNGTEWYARRATVAGIYAASELHQLASPTTAEGFMNSLIDHAEGLASIPEGVGLFGMYVTRSWQGIIRSSGLF